MILYDPKLLTERQRSVVIMIASGIGGKQSAYQLHISLSALNQALYNAYKKIGVSDHIQLTHWALKTGLIKNLFEGK